MKTIDLKAIIEASGLDLDFAASQLFPTNQYATLALNRVMNGKALLKSDQVAILSKMVNIPIGDLYSGKSWTPNSRDGMHEFTNGDYKATLDTNTWITKVFHKEAKIYNALPFQYQLYECRLIQPFQRTRRLAIAQSFLFRLRR